MSSSAPHGLLGAVDDIPFEAYCVPNRRAKNRGSDRYGMRVSANESTARQEARGIGRAEGNRLQRKQ